tara:strand:+ start:372 stop:560 length:189 start_codon:yes stop_codon:yes gene_type:complete
MNDKTKVDKFASEEGVRVSTSVRLRKDIMDRIREDASSNLRPLTYQIEWIINKHYERQNENS